MLVQIVMTHSRGERITIETKKLGTAVVYGVLSIFIFGAATSLIFSLFLRFSSMDESSLTYVIMAASFISLFIGGFISGGKGKRQGWVLGGGTGLLYTLIILLFHYLGHDALFTMKQWISSICLILTSMMGGILGVNLKSGSRTN